MWRQLGLFPSCSKKHQKVGSSQCCSRKQPVHSDKQTSICAAHNLSCSGTGPSGLARITAATHPQPLSREKSQESIRAGCRWVGRVGEKKPRWEVTSVGRVTATSTRVDDGQSSCPTPPPTLGVAQETWEARL